MRGFVMRVVVLLVVLAHSSSVSATPPAAAAREVQKAWSLYQTGDCKGAQGILSDALKLTPEWDVLHFNIAVSAERCGDLHLAAKEYREYAAISPQDRQWVSAHATRLEEPRKERQRRRLPWWGWVLIGAGAAAIVATAVALTLTEEEDPYDDSYYELRGRAEALRVRW